jgi:DNA-binding Lrp family transcriptional regulator
VSQKRLSSSEAQALFQKFLKSAERELQRKHKRQIPIVRFSDNPPNPNRSSLGVELTLNELVVPQGEFWMMKGILCLEAFKLLLPSSIGGLSHATDLAWAFAYHELDAEEKERWHILWLETPGVGERVDVGDLLYDPVEALVLLEHLSNGGGLSELVRMFERLDRFHIRLGTEDFIRQSEEFISKRTVALKLREIRIITLMLQDTTISVESLAHRTNLSPPVVSTVQASLRRRGILYTKPTVNLSKLGYHTHLLYMTPKPTQKLDLLEKLRKNEQLSALKELVDGERGYLATFALPDNPESKASLEGLKKELRPLCLPDQFTSFSVKRRFHFINLRSYSPKKGRWDMNWRAWSLWFKRMLQEGLPRILPHREEIVEAEEAPTLDQTDQAILTEISRGEWRTRQLREKLRIGSNVLAARMRRLRRERLIKDEVGLRFIGLDDTAYLIFYGRPEEMILLVAGFNELPSHTTAEVDGEKNGLLTTLHLPTGDAVTMAHYLRKHLPSLPLEIRFGIEIPLTYRYFPPHLLY